MKIDLCHVGLGVCVSVWPKKSKSRLDFDPSLLLKIKQTRENFLFLSRIFKYIFKDANFQLDISTFT